MTTEPQLDKTITFPCLLMSQPIGSFYVGVLRSQDLCEIAFSDVRKIEGGSREIESFSGIERPLSQKRVKELEKYVTNVDASFPSGVIVAVSSNDAIYDQESRSMTLRYGKDVAEVIDGQHRIEGLRQYHEGNFQMNVTIFVDMEKEDQAILFSTINLKQTPVAKSLVYDLFEYAESRSPQKTSHNIARVLNYRTTSPFNRRIMILGTATGHPNETLTQAAFVEPLLKLITRDPDSDRDALKRGKAIPPPSDTEIRTKNLVFRRMFLDEKDSAIAKTIQDYFSAVAQRWPNEWNNKVPRSVLIRTTGYRAFMRFLPLAMFSLGLNATYEAGDYLAILKRVTLEEGDFTTDRFKPGSSGEGELYRRLIANTGIDERVPWKGLA